MKQNQSAPSIKDVGFCKQTVNDFFTFAHKVSLKKTANVKEVRKELEGCIENYQLLSHETGKDFSEEIYLCKKIYSAEDKIIQFCLEEYKGKTIQEEIVKKSFSDIIKEKRQELGMTQQEFGSLLGFESNTISTWESGKSIPVRGIDTLEIISQKTGIDIYILFDGLRQEETKHLYFPCNKEFGMDAEKQMKSLHKKKQVLTGVMFCFIATTILLIVLKSNVLNSFLPSDTHVSLMRLCYKVFYATIYITTFVLINVVFHNPYTKVFQSLEIEILKENNLLMIFRDINNQVLQYEFLQRPTIQVWQQDNTVEGIRLNADCIVSHFDTNGNLLSEHKEESIKLSSLNIRKEHIYQIRAFI